MRTGSNVVEDLNSSYKSEVIHVDGKRSENPVIGFFFSLLKIIWNLELDIKYSPG